MYFLGKEKGHIRGATDLFQKTNVAPVRRLLVGIKHTPIWENVCGAHRLRHPIPLI